MPDPENGRRRYRVHCSTVIAEALRQLQRRSSGAARKRSIAAAFRRIVQRLQINPQKVGEPLYRLQGLRLQIRTCIVPPLIVHFGVSEDHALVFIKSVRLLSGS